MTRTARLRSAFKDVGVMLEVEALPSAAYTDGIAQPGFQVSTRSDVTAINWYAGEGVDWSKVGYPS